MTSPRICSIIYLLSGLAVAETETNPVSVEIRQIPIVFGGNAILFCNLSKVSGCCINTVTWMRNYEVIVHHGVSVNASKYKQIQTMNGFSLQITQFEYTDMRVKYVCLYKFMSAAIYLEWDENKFEKHPKGKAVSQIKEWNDKTQRIYTINLAFEEVFPMPKCRILSDGYEFKTVSQSIKNGMVSNVSVHINVNYTERNCGQNITGVCSIGKFNMTWSCGPPLNCYNSHSVANDRIETAVVISSTVFAIIIISTAVVSYQKCKTKQNETDNTEHELLLLGDGNEQGRNGYQVGQWFPICSKKNFTKLVKENEMNFKEKEIAKNNTEINERRVYLYDRELSSNYPMQRIRDILLFLSIFVKGQWVPRYSKKNFAKLVKENEMNFVEKEIAKNNTEINERRVYFYDLGKYLKNDEFNTNQQREVKQYCKDLSSNYPMQRNGDTLLSLRTCVEKTTTAV